MSFKIGLSIVFVSLIIGFLGGGGNILVLLQPFELLIIVGTAIGSFIIANPKSLLKAVNDDLHKVLKNGPYSEDDYMELLIFLFNLFRYAKTNSLMDLEPHIEEPEKSYLFKRFNNLVGKKEVTIFLCDYMRLIVLGFDNAFELQQMMEEEINEKRNQRNEVALALHRLGDSLPGLGILAAVLGVINAMAAIASDPAILGHKIASALIGTFLGVFFCYGVVSPMGSFLTKYGSDEIKYLECIKAALVSYAKGHTPTISVECARQIIPESFKPSFIELERSLRKNLITR